LVNARVRQCGWGRDAMEGWSSLSRKDGVLRMRNAAAALRPTQNSSSVAGKDPWTRFLITTTWIRHDILDGCFVIALPCFDELSVQRSSAVGFHHISLAMRLDHHPTKPRRPCQPRMVRAVRACHARAPYPSSPSPDQAQDSRPACADLLSPNHLHGPRQEIQPIRASHWIEIGSNAPRAGILGQIAACGAYFRFLGTTLDPLELSTALPAQSEPAEGERRDPELHFNAGRGFGSHETSVVRRKYSVMAKPDTVFPPLALLLWPLSTDESELVGALQRMIPVLFK
jgi:hypothetical protein